MKSLNILLFLSLVALCSCNLEQVSPADYNDAIFVQQMRVKNLITDLAKAPDSRVRSEILEELRIQAETSKQKIQEIGPFRGDDQLINAAIPLFDYYWSLAHEALDVPADEIPMVLDQNIKRQAEEEQKFFKAQGVFAEEYELFL